ncbi:MAG: CooT family nickel-binding protein [Spirochaetota bacterium]|nr:CooT family nickel-binding protein [Spirochaetota bacterium]
MCQINACLISDGSEHQIMEDVQLLDFEDDDIVLRDLFGDEKRLKAKIKLINIAKNKILLEAL